MPDGSVGMIISSPPYAGAQKYVRSASLSLGWLDLAPSKGLRQLEEQTIGREHYAKASWANVGSTGIDEADALIAAIAQENQSRAKIVGTYLVEMRAALSEAVRVLRPGGCFVLVIGDNTVCGRRFPSSDYLRLMLEEMGMTTILSLVDQIPSRGLMTRRNKTAGIIAAESVIVLRKDACPR
jgi:DNA modification methylase